MLAVAESRLKIVNDELSGAIFCNMSTAVLMMLSAAAEGPSAAVITSMIFSLTSTAVPLATTNWLSARRHRLSLWSAGRPSCPRYGVGHDATESLQAKAQPGPRGARQGRLRRPHRT